MKKSSLIGMFLLIVLGTIFFPNCDETTGPDDEKVDPIALQIEAVSDTLLLLVNNSHKVTVLGVFAETTENIITNSGILTDTSYTYFTTDTAIERIQNKQLDWYSSNESIITVKDGNIKGVAPGVASVWAAVGDVISDTLNVIVSSAQLPPVLIVDPPPVQLIFQDTTTITGWITLGLDILLTINDDTVSYFDDGRFSGGVHLTVGENQFEIEAENLDNGLSTVKSKLIVYYPIESSGIEGHWNGETLTRPFSFDIYKLFGVYVIDGTMTVDATMLGGPLIVRDVVIAGLIRADGTIDATLNREYSGMVLTGYLNGIFIDSGTAAGKYGVKIEKDDWPTATATALWNAERE